MMAPNLAATIADSVLEPSRAARAKSDGEFVKATYDGLTQFLAFDVLLLARAPLSQISLAHAHLHGIADPEAALVSRCLASCEGLPYQTE
jgi:hypothetical protein